MPKDEETALFMAWRDRRDEVARAAPIDAHVALVDRMITRQLRLPLAAIGARWLRERCKIEMAGRLDRFDPARSVRISTYFRFVINKTIRRDGDEARGLLAF